jgi:nitroreductase
MPILKLTPDELLSTTRAVRRRLDLTRAVPPELVEECVALAVQAPTSTNMQNWHFIIVTDSDRRAALAELYRRSWSSYADGRPPDEAPASETSGQASSRYMAAHLQEVPVHVIPCIEGRPEGMAQPDLAWFYGSIIQAGWSFQLAARARGLGSVWTTFHLDHEPEAAGVLGIPFEQITQVALLPVAYTLGTDFRPAPRRPLETVLHWESW